MREEAFNELLNDELFVSIFADKQSVDEILRDLEEGVDALTKEQLSLLTEKATVMRMESDIEELSDELLDSIAGGGCRKSCYGTCRHTKSKRVCKKKCGC